MVWNPFGTELNAPIDEAFGSFEFPFEFEFKVLVLRDRARKSFSFWRSFKEPAVRAPSSILQTVLVFPSQPSKVLPSKSGFASWATKAIGPVAEVSRTMAQEIALEERGMKRRARLRWFGVLWLAMQSSLQACVLKIRYRFASCFRM